MKMLGGRFAVPNLAFNLVSKVALARRFVLITIVMAIPVASATSSAQDQPGDKLKFRSPAELGIEFDEATLLFLEPTDASGWPNYPKAINNWMLEQTPAESNAAVALLPYMVPTFIEPKYLEELGFGEEMLRPNLRSPVRYVINQGREQEYEPALDGPWDPMQLTAMADWVELSSESLDGIGVALRRPNFYVPAIPAEVDRPWMSSIAHLQSYRVVARALVVRANMRIQQGDIEGAWYDIYSLLSFASHMDQSFTLLERLLGKVCAEMAYECGANLLEALPTMGEPLKQIEADLKKLPRPNYQLDRMGLGEKILLLELIRELASGEFRTLELESADAAIAIRLAIMSKRVNWQHVIEALFAQIDAAYGAEGISATLDAVAKTSAEPHGGEGLAKAITRMKQTDEKEQGELVTDFVIARLSKGITSAPLSAVRSLAAAEIQRDTFGLMIATHRFSRKEHRWPESLEELVPNYIEGVPVDPIGKKPYELKITDGQISIQRVVEEGGEPENRSTEAGSMTDRGMTVSTRSR